MKAEKLNGTTGSLMKLLEKDKHNTDHQKDFQAIKDFINQNTGFRFSYGNCNGKTLVIRAFAK